MASMPAARPSAAPASQVPADGSLTRTATNTTPAAAAAGSDSRPVRRRNRCVIVRSSHQCFSPDALTSSSSSNAISPIRLPRLASSDIEAFSQLVQLRRQTGQGEGLLSDIFRRDPLLVDCGCDLLCAGRGLLGDRGDVVDRPEYPVRVGRYAQYRA